MVDLPVPVGGLSVIVCNFLGSGLDPGATGRILSDTCSAYGGAKGEPGSVVPGWDQGVDQDVDSDAGEFEPTDAEVDEAFAQMWSLQRGLTGPGWNGPGQFIWTTPTSHTYQRDPEPPLGRPRTRSHHPSNQTRLAGRASC